ncbi:uncharacterized protein LOC135816728 [Sycon ciliatum]|uniref:uncharacterized protein LOC135816728 n=1 Tax=Sycon ciliatum TaxID=27933 RepID=UPI0031F68A3F
MSSTWQLFFLIILGFCYVFSATMAGRSSLKELDANAGHEDETYPDEPIHGDPHTDEPIHGDPHPDEPVDCLELLLTRADVRKAFIPAYLESFRRNGLDSTALFKLSFPDLVEMLQRKEFDITYAGDVYRIHDCTTGRGHCVLDPICKNGGKCVFKAESNRHACECPKTFHGHRCETSKKDRLSDVESMIKGLEKSAVDSVGATYTRWGKSTCNDTAGASLVYTGFMAGAFYTFVGGTTDFVCLPFDPIYSDSAPGVQGLSNIYVAEFETLTFTPFKPLHDRHPQCAVCRTSGKAAEFMLPARRSCPDQWTLQYEGYLMTSHRGHRRTKYICVDGEPDVDHNPPFSTNGALLYMVEAVCPTEMPCPPYDKEKEMTCAVCAR